MKKLWKRVKRLMEKWSSPKELTNAARRRHVRQEKAQDPRKQTRYTYSDGPMYYLGQQILRGMQDAGYPSKINECYRSFERQDDLKRQGRSKAHGGQSPHQYYEAVDICHKTRGWDVSQEYWDTLRVVGRNVAEKFGVTLEFGYDWGWDSAHIELKDFRKVRAEFLLKFRGGEKPRPPNARELWTRFHEVLPKVARRYELDHAGPPVPVKLLHVRDERFPELN